MRTTLVYLLTLIAVVAIVVYLNLMKPFGQDLKTPVEAGVHKISQQINSVLNPASETELLLDETITEHAVLTEEKVAMAEAEIEPTPIEKASTPTEEGMTPLTNEAQPSVALEEVAETAADAPAAISTNTTRVLLIPDRETTIASTTTGRIIRLKGNLGQRFNKKDVLVSFDCNQATAHLEIAKAELSGAIEQHEAKVKMQGLDQASDVEVALAASASNKAKAELRLNRSMVSECKIYAPWKGRVAKAHVRNSMTVNAGEPLLDIVNTGPLKLKLNIASHLLNKIKVGGQFNVIIDETGQEYSAKIKAINSRIDPVSQTVEVEAKMDKAHKELLAGMSGTADFASFGSDQ